MRGLAMRRAPVLALFLASAALRAADKVPAPTPGGPVPIPYPNTGATARDLQTGQATGQRMHKPWVFSASDRKITLLDGRKFVVNSETGEIVFGDGLQGKRPDPGAVPKDGRYRVGEGAAGDVEVRAGRIVIPTPVPTRATSKAK
jgi:hypothetical protein